MGRDGIGGYHLRISGFACHVALSRDLPSAWLRHLAGFQHEADNACRFADSARPHDDEPTNSIHPEAELFRPWFACVGPRGSWGKCDRYTAKGPQSPLGLIVDGGVDGLHRGTSEKRCAREQICAQAGKVNDASVLKSLVSKRR